MTSVAEFERRDLTTAPTWSQIFGRSGFTVGTMHGGATKGDHPFLKC